MSECYMLEASTIKGSFKDAPVGLRTPYCQSREGFAKSNAIVLTTNQIDRLELFKFFREKEQDGKVALFQGLEDGLTTYYFVKLSDSSRKFLTEIAK